MRWPSQRLVAQCPKCFTGFGGWISSATTSTCDEAIEGLEKIDDETDALDITMVKVNDARYAKKYGVNKMPALVYFRRKFPSIYRDNLFDEDTILEWLTSNRYKQLELGVFMYAIVSLAITFMCYTAFLLFGLKPKEPEKKKEE